MIIENILLELEKYRDTTHTIKIGYMKEFLQTAILKQIYEIQECKNLMFYGGTALRFLFGLNRLSEDLDFIGKDFTTFDIVGSTIQNFFHKNHIIVHYKIQKHRIILNFKNLLSNFDIHYGNSKDLYIKIEISDHIDFCKSFEPKLYPLFKYSMSLVIKSLDKSTLFSTKINAILYRNWEKKVGDTTIHVKGRDIYDLFWYLTNGFTPNMDCIIGIYNLEDLKNKLTATIERIHFKEVILDIENFVEDASILDFIINNGKNYILEKIKEM